MFLIMHILDFFSSFFSKSLIHFIIILFSRLGKEIKYISIYINHNKSENICECEMKIGDAECNV